VCTKLEEFKPQELANLLWAFASLEYLDVNMMEAATHRASMFAACGAFKEQELANTIWAMGRQVVVY
jgi:hypothetical protein